MLVPAPLNLIWIKKQIFTKNRVAIYDPAIPLLGIYPGKTISRKGTCTPMFTAALFTIAKTWKQLKCRLTEEWIKKMWFIYTMEYYSAIKKWNNAICSNMAGPRHCQTEWSKSNRERQISYNITYMWNLKRMIQMNLFTKQKQTLKTNLWLPKGKGGREGSVSPGRPAGPSCHPGFSMMAG